MVSLFNLSISTEYGRWAIMTLVPPLIFIAREPVKIIRTSDVNSIKIVNKLDS